MGSNNKDVNIDISFSKKEGEKFLEERSWTKYHTPKNLI